MAGITERIFPLGTSLERLTEFSGNRFSPIPTVLLIGHPNSLKTTLLMQAAVSEGSVGGQVLFIAPNKLGHLPPSIHGMACPTSSAMNNIKFLYATQTSELQGYLSSMHLTPVKDLPSLIIIDDLHKYVKVNDSGDVAQMMVSTARILSLAQETAQYCHDTLRKETISTETGRTNPLCSILMSWTSCASDLFKQADLELTAKDFCHHVWHVKQVCNKGVSHISREYQMVQSLFNATCTISFSSRCISSSTKDVVFRQAILETEDDSQNQKGKSSRLTTDCR